MNHTSRPSAQLKCLFCGRNRRSRQIWAILHHAATHTTMHPVCFVAPVTLVTFSSLLPSRKSGLLSKFHEFRPQGPYLTLQFSNYICIRLVLDALLLQIEMFVHHFLPQRQCFSQVLFVSFCFGAGHARAKTTIRTGHGSPGHCSSCTQRNYYQGCQ